MFLYKDIISCNCLYKIIEGDCTHFQFINDLQILKEKAKLIYPNKLIITNYTFINVQIDQV